MFFFESFQSDNYSRLNLGRLLALGLFLTSSAAAEECRAKADLAATTARSEIAVHPSEECFDWLVPERGWAMVTVNGERPLHLDLEGISAGFEVLHQTADSLLVAAEPGVYRVRIAPQDSLEALGTYRIQTAHLPAARAQRGQMFGALTEDDEEEGIEVVIDPFAAPCPSSMKSEEDEEEGIEVVIDPFAAPCGQANAARIDRTTLQGRILNELCAQTEGDDHGDSWLCATALDTVLSGGKPISHGEWAGELGEGDRDLFVFEADHRSRVTLSIEGGPLMTLYDEHGQEMGSADDRLARTLSRGRYFVGVESTLGDLRYELVLYRGMGR